MQTCNEIFEYIVVYNHDKLKKKSKVLMFCHLHIQLISGSKGAFGKTPAGFAVVTPMKTKEKVNRLDT